MCQQPGHQQQLLRVGQQQAHQQHQVGGEAHPVHLHHAGQQAGARPDMLAVFDNVKMDCEQMFNKLSVTKRSSQE